MTLVEMLEAGRARIADVKDWTVGALARRSDGKKTHPGAPGACQWCGLGALIWVVDQSDDLVKNDALRIPANELLDEAAGEVSRDAVASSLLHGPRPIPFLNDGPNGHARVLRAYDIAIAKAREKEAAT